MCQPPNLLRGERKGTRMGWGYKDAKLPPRRLYCRRKGNGRTDAALKVEGRIFPSSSHSTPLAACRLWKIARSEKIAALVFRHGDEFLPTFHRPNRKRSADSLIALTRTRHLQESIKGEIITCHLRLLLRERACLLKDIATSFDHRKIASHSCCKCAPFTA